MSAENNISWFIAGLGLGAAVGLLFAPKSGADTRSFLGAKVDDGTGYIKRTAEQLHDSTQDLVDKAKSTIAEQQGQVSAAIDAGKQAFRDALKQNREPRPSESA